MLRNSGAVLEHSALRERPELLVSNVANDRIDRPRHEVGAEVRDDEDDVVPAVPHVLGVPQGLLQDPGRDDEAAEEQGRERDPDELLQGLTAQLGRDLSSQRHSLACSVVTTIHSSPSIKEPPVPRVEMDRFAWLWNT